MGRQREEMPTRTEPLLGRITTVENGYPAPWWIARNLCAAPSPQEGWFWIMATPASAARIRVRGHRVRGTVTETWIPPQERGGIIKPEDRDPGDRPTEVEVHRGQAAQAEIDRAAA